MITGAWKIAIYTENQISAQQLPVSDRSLCLHFRLYEFGILEVLKFRELLALCGPDGIESRLDQMFGGQTFGLFTGCDRVEHIWRQQCQIKALSEERFLIAETRISQLAIFDFSRFFRIGLSESAPFQVFRVFL